MMKKNARHSWQGGFSLIELLIAIALLSVGLLAVAGMQGVGINANSQAINLTVATSLAEQAMEDFLSRELADPVVNTEAANVLYAPINNLTVTGAGTFTARYSVALNQPVTGASRITVTVASGSRAVTLISFKRVI